MLTVIPLWVYMRLIALNFKTKEEIEQNALKNMVIMGCTYGFFFMVGFAVDRVIAHMVNNIGTERQNMRF